MFKNLINKNSIKINNFKLKIIFFGSSKFVLPILEGLRKNLNLSLVLTTESPTLLSASQGQALRSYLLNYPVVKFCIDNKIPYKSVSDLSDPNLKSLIVSIKSPVGILADFGLFIPQEILNAFSKGIVNIHPSLLPKYRGPTPVQTAILNGEKITGVSIMKLDEEIDHGPLLGQEKEEILDIDTAESLYKRLFEKGANLLLKVLNNYLKDNLKPIPQNHIEATFTKSLTREDGYIDISNVMTTVVKIERMIRAYYPWPGVWTNIMINEKLLRIKFLPGEKIQAEGKKPVSYKDFINGYPEAKEIIGKLT